MTKIILILGGVAVLIAVIVLGKRNASTVITNGVPQWAVPENRAVDPKNAKTSPGYVDKCHDAFKMGTAQVGSKYGVPNQYTDVGAKINPYYYTCDIGGYISTGAKTLWNKIF